MPTLTHLAAAALLLAAALPASGDAAFAEAPQFYNPPECSPTAVHVAMTLDAAYLRGTMAAVHSILKHSSCPQSIFFHFIASPSDETIAALTADMAAAFPSLAFRVYPFADEPRVRGLISTSIREALDEPLNYARSYIAHILPAAVSKVVYLDSDIIAVDDVSELYDTPMGGAVVAAPEYCSADFARYFTAEFWSSPALSVAFAGVRPCYFNTGVMVLDLERWRAGAYTEKIEEWMAVRRRLRIYDLGSLPPFLLVFAGRIAAVDHRWNQHGLGGDNRRGDCRGLHPGPVSLLHWSGRGKPWARIDAGRPCAVDALWALYDLRRPAAAAALR